MIKHNGYSVEYKEKIARELSLRKIGVTEMSKRENVAPSTLRKWVNRFGYIENSTKIDNSSELKQLRKKVSEYENALGEMALELHLLKKMEKFSFQLKRKQNLSSPISPSILVSK